MLFYFIFTFVLFPFQAAVTVVMMYYVFDVQYPSELEIRAIFSIAVWVDLPQKGKIRPAIQRNLNFLLKGLH